MSSPSALHVSRTVTASPEAIFAVLTDPGLHAEFDSAGMLRGIEDADEPISAVGDRFVMAMHNDTLGGYRIRNTVVAFEPDRVIGWAPELYPPEGYTHILGGMRPGGHTYTWHLEPLGDGRTTVTQVYDWSGVTDENFRARCPMLTEEQLAASITAVAALAG